MKTGLFFLPQQAYWTVYITNVHRPPLTLWPCGGTEVRIFVVIIVKFLVISPTVRGISTHVVVTDSDITTPKKPRPPSLTVHIFTMPEAICMLIGTTLCYKFAQYRVIRCIQNKMVMKCDKNHASWLRHFEDVSMTVFGHLRQLNKISQLSLHTCHSAGNQVRTNNGLQLIIRVRQIWTRMWANAQSDGRPAEHRWRPLFNAAQFGWRPQLDALQ